MLSLRGLNSSAPAEPNLRMMNNPTLLFSWWCTGFALTIIIVRLCGRMVRNNQLFREDKLMFLSVIPLLIRMALVHVILIWGTNNTDVSKGLDANDIYHRSIGSRLVLASRIFYAMFIWMAKFTVSEFLKRLTSSFWKKGYQIGLHTIRWFLVVTFVAVVIATLAECQPFEHYWQVVPDPGPQCRLGYAQLITMGTADMITDVLLIFFPIPIVLRSSAFNLKRKISLILLFSLSGVLVGVTGYRVKSVIAHHGRQQYRSVFASGEILAAAAVSNAIVIGSFLRDRGVKKQKYKYSSATDSMERPATRRTTMANLTNDSDIDLFEDMCYRTAPDLEELWVPRPPPIATVSSGVRRGSDMLKIKDSYFSSSTGDSSRGSEDSDPKTAVEEPPLSPLSSPKESNTSPPGRRTVSFCDVGGLLEDASSRSSTLAPSPSTATTAQDFASPPTARRGSRQILSDLGGFLSPILSPHHRPSQEDIHESQEASGALTPLSPAAPIPSPLLNRVETEQSLQDVGGLLISAPPTQWYQPSSSSSTSLPPPPPPPKRDPSPKFSQPLQE